MKHGLSQALSLQLRLSLFVDELALYDRTKAAGVAVDLSHIPAKQVCGRVTLVPSKRNCVLSSARAGHQRL